MQTEYVASVCCAIERIGEFIGTLYSMRFKKNVPSQLPEQCVFVVSHSPSVTNKRSDVLR